MQTKTTIQFRQHFNALLNLLLPQQCLLCRWVCFDRGLCADCWQGLVFNTPPFCLLLISTFRRLDRSRPSDCAASASCQTISSSAFQPTGKADAPVMQAKSKWHLCSRGIDAAKSLPDTGRIEPKPATAQSSRRVCHDTRPASPHRQSARAVD